MHPCQHFIQNLAPTQQRQDEKSTNSTRCFYQNSTIVIIASRIILFIFSCYRAVFQLFYRKKWKGY